MKTPYLVGNRKIEQEFNIVQHLKTISESAELWHQQLGYSDAKFISQLATITTGMKISNSKQDITKCETCIVSKMTKNIQIFNKTSFTTI
jgi:hypothetical protein